MAGSSLLSAIGVLSFAALLASAANAQPSAEEGPEVELDGGASTGAVAANLAAGSFNQQANVGGVASGDAALATALLAQSLSTPELGHTPSARATIAEGAFAGSSGWIAANLGAGDGNQQANVAVIGIGLSGQLATAAMLSQSRASTVRPESDQTTEASDRFRTEIGEGAFQDSSGLVQVNLAAGDGNSSANVFALSVPGQ